MKKNKVLTLKTLTRIPEAGILIVLLLLIVVFSILSPRFFSASNVINVARQISEVAIAAIGMTFVIIAGEIDLSPGSVYAFGAAVCAMMLHFGSDPAIALIVSLIVCALIGAINGLFITLLRIPSFIITLCTQMIVRGAVFIVLGGATMCNFPDTETWIFKMGSKIGGVFPVQIIIMIVLVVVVSIILKHTSFGFKLYALGGNMRAAKVCGINTTRTKIIAFVLSSVLAGLAGLISLSYLKSVAPSAGVGREMDIVAACILGGANLAGGQGTILGTLIGATIVGIIRNALVLLGVDAFYQTATVGLVILTGVCVDTLLRRKNNLQISD